jgi:hypothetical protein
LSAITVRHLVVPSSPIKFDHHRLYLRRDNGRFNVSAGKFGNRFKGTARNPPLCRDEPSRANA